METINSEIMLKSVMRRLSTQSTASVGQKIMLYDNNDMPIGKMQAPTDDQGAPIQFGENNQATANTPPSATAGSATMGKLYLVGPKVGTKWQWITLEDDTTTPATYSWLQIGTTDVDLSQYARTEDLSLYARAEYATEQSVRNIVRNYAG